jgi:hypothetical protein
MGEHQAESEDKFQEILNYNFFINITISQLTNSVMYGWCIVY